MLIRPLLLSESAGGRCNRLVEWLGTQRGPARTLEPVRAGMGMFTRDDRSARWVLLGD